MHSYHIFYFPFKWNVPGREHLLFSEQIDLKKIPINSNSNWERNPNRIDETEEDELYNEKNYFYQFVHSILYDTRDDDSVVFHYERRETKRNNVYYKVKVKDHPEYVLKLKAINLNLYSTGVGILNFYVENIIYSDKDDVLRINQFGRRVFPPFIADIKNRFEIAEYIAIEGLDGIKNYREDFSSYTNQMPWKMASFINDLISDFSDGIEYEPVIDDRMFVNSTYSCPDLSESFKHSIEDDFWYKYLFVDHLWPTCQNLKMRKELLEKQTYVRWQEYGTLYGFSYHSLVLLLGEVNESNGFLPVHMRTIYSRMTEIVLIVRASVLKFSNEIKEVSKLTKGSYSDRVLINRINSLYKEYIRFVNQFYFREISAQEQGVELYDLMLKTLKLETNIKDLDAEIEELYSYVMMLEERERNRKASTLNLIATLFLPASLLVGWCSMSYYKGNHNDLKHGFVELSIIIFLIAVVASWLIMHFTKSRRR